MLNTLKTVLENDSFLGAIFSSIAIILTGFFLRRKNIVDDTAGKTLTKILMSAALPALAFRAFIADISQQTFKTGMNVFVFGFIAYIALIIITKVLYANYRGNRQLVLRMLTIFGSTTFFGIPIINAFLGPMGTLYANLFNIAYRVFLYSYCLIMMSGLSFRKENFKAIFANPIIIATFLGLILWFGQNYMPQVAVGGQRVSIFRFDKTAPWLFMALNYLGGLSSPLAWLAIGITLAKISLKEASKDKDVSVYSLQKLVVTPLVFLGIMVLMRKANLLPLSYEAITAIMIMLATPPATVAVAYAINYDKEPVFASNCSLVSTVFSVVAIIAWVFVLAAMHGAKII